METPTTTPAAQAYTGLKSEVPANRISRIAGQITVHGELTTHTRLDLKREAFDALTEGEGSLSIRFDPDKFLDTAALTALLSIAKYAHERHVKPILAGLTDDQRELLETIKVAQYFVFEA